MSDRRAEKILVIAAGVAVSYMALLSAFLPDRATVDERTKVGDIREILHSGHVVTVDYFSGLSHQIFTGTILKLSGLHFADLQWLSPLLGSLCLALFAACLYSLYRRDTARLQWSFALAFAVFFVFGTVVNGLQETSHKKYTYALLLLLAVVTLRNWRTEQYHRFAVLTLLFGVALATFNYIWSVIYLTATLAASGFAYPSQLERAASLLFAGLLSAWVVVEYVPGLHLHRGYIVALVYSVFASPGGSGTASEAAGSLSQWPTIEVAGVAINSWFVWSSGIAVAAILGGIAATVIVARMLLRRPVTPLQRGIVAFCIPFGALMVVPVLKGDVATVRRLAVLPGVFGTLGFASLIARSQVNWLAAYRGDILAVVLAVLIITSGLAVNRTYVNGDESLIDSPLDSYMSDNERAKLVFVDSHKTSDSCLRTTESMDRWGAFKWHNGPLVPITDERVRDDRVYTSGDKGVVICA